MKTIQHTIAKLRKWTKWQPCIKEISKRKTKKYKKIVNLFYNSGQNEFSLKIFFFSQKKIG